MKVAAPAAATPPAAPAPDMAAPAAPAPEAGGEDLDFSGDDAAAPADDKPFDKEPFDAGVEADEDTDPKKFIEQLSGKIGQSLRKYTEETGQPDFELEKFAINSLLSATHTAEMDEDDKKDIIKKVNTSGAGDSNDSDMGDEENDSEAPEGDDMDFSGSEDENLQESEMTNLFVDAKKMSIFAPEGSKEFMEINRLDENKPCWSGYKQIGMKEKGGREVPNCVPIDENMGTGGESNNYMFWQNLKTIHHASGELLEMGHEEVDSMIANGHAWAVDHIATSADDIEEVYHFMEANLEDSGDYDGETEHGYEDEYGSVEHIMREGENDNKPLGKPMKGDVKKFKVYVKNSEGNVVKVNFGDPNMEIKRDNPERKKSFRARHKCSQAKDRTTPKYWSCKMWSDTPVSKMVAENLTGNEKNSIFGKDLLKAKLHETFKPEDMTETVEPIVKPIVKPDTKPAPSRRSKPFTIEPDSVPQTDPKALNENKKNVKTVNIFIPNEAILKRITTTPTFSRLFRTQLNVGNNIENVNHAQFSDMMRLLPLLSGVEVTEKTLNEGKFDYETYHKTLASCFNEAETYVTKRGYDPIEFQLSDPQHVNYGETQKYHKELTVNGKLQRKELHIQIYRMDSGTYELNMYVN